MKGDPEPLGAIIERGARFPAPPEAPPRQTLASIPEKYRSITWDTLAKLVNPDGAPALGGVIARDAEAVLAAIESRDRRAIAKMIANGCILLGSEAMCEIRRRCSGADHVVLLGPTHAGKTITASAILNEAADIGAAHVVAREAGKAKGQIREERARFVRELDLKDPEVLARARTAGVLVLDNMGWALDGARFDSPLAAQKRGPTCELLDALSCRKFRSHRLIVTTWLDQDEMATAYSGGVVARVYEGAEVIRVVRPEVGT